MEQPHHGVHTKFEISGEGQFDSKKPAKPPGEGPRFGRIFLPSSATPPFTPSDASLDQLGRAMTTPGNGGDDTIPAGYTYFGQFIDHDITKDGTADLPDEVKKDLTLDEIKQLRSPSLDLDSLYETPPGKPELKAADGIHMRLGATQSTGAAQPTPPFGQVSAKDYPRHDVPRNGVTGAAEIGDPRNDENLIVQQIHNVFLRFHNAVADHVAAKAGPLATPEVVFAVARELVTKHYQWLVLNDFVKRISDPQVFAEILGQDANTCLITPNPLIFKISAAQTPPMPLEFSVAAYRLGHSMIRNGYAWNCIFVGSGFQPFFTFTELSGVIGKPNAPIPGLVRFPSNWIADWRRMFDLEIVSGFPPFPRGPDPDIPLNVTRKIDTELAAILGTLPGGTNLASRNLIRGSRMNLPSGQDVAHAIIAAGDSALAVLTPKQLLDSAAGDRKKALLDHEFHMKTPLWYYILAEAELNGGRLGRLGSRIVIETFLALIRCSKTSILAAVEDPAGSLVMFSPEKDSKLRINGDPLTTMSHLIVFAGDVNPLGDNPNPGP